MGSQITILEAVIIGVISVLLFVFIKTLIQFLNSKF